MRLTLFFCAFVTDDDPDEFPDAEPRYPDPKVNFQSLGPTANPPREAECVRRWHRGELDPEFDEENLRVPAPDHSWPVRVYLNLTLCGQLD